MKKGFTLAEMLITIAIIGVVAALTMPALMTNVSNKAKESAIKKAIYCITNANNTMLAVEDVDTMDELSDYAEKLPRYLKIDENGETDDGMTYLNISTTSITVDINGNDEPNNAGVDQFELAIREDGTATFDWENFED